jgi:hypothetical protein
LGGWHIGRKANSMDARWRWLISRAASRRSNSRRTAAVTWFSMDQIKPMTDWWNNLQNDLKRSSDKRIEAASQTTDHFKALDNAVEPVGGAFNKVSDSAGSVAAALDALTAKINSWHPPEVNPYPTSYENPLRTHFA